MNTDTIPNEEGSPEMSERTSALTFTQLIYNNNISDPLALNSGVVADKVSNKEFFIHILKLAFILLLTPCLLLKLPARRTIMEFPTATDEENDYRINLTEVNPLNRKIYIYVQG